MNIFDVIIGLLVAGALGLALWRMHSHKTSCSCGCSDCKSSCCKK